MHWGMSQVTSQQLWADLSAVFSYAGIKYPCETKFDNQLQDYEQSHYTLNIPLIPTTPEEMEDMLKLCSHVRFKVPQQVEPFCQLAYWT